MRNSVIWQAAVGVEVIGFSFKNHFLTLETTLQITSLPCLMLEHKQASILNNTNRYLPRTKDEAQSFQV